jgi:hypothetical protein
MFRAGCYYCGKTAVSREHIPPFCFFKETNKLSINQLVTVPSCNAHNSEKSGDDLYLLFVISSHSSSNDYARIQFRKSVIPAFKKDPSLYSWLTDYFPAIVNNQPSVAITINKSRFDTEIEHMAKGIYFKHCHYRSRWKHEVYVLSPELFLLNEKRYYSKTNRVLQDDYKAMATILDKQPIFGTNRNVFYYKYYEDEKNYAVEMIFYKGFRVATISIKES